MGGVGGVGGGSSGAGSGGGPDGGGGGGGQMGAVGGGVGGGGGVGPMGPNNMGGGSGPGINGNDLDAMKNSPANGGPGTPRDDSGSGMGDYNLGGFGPGENVSIFLYLRVENAIWSLLMFFRLYMFSDTKS